MSTKSKFLFTLVALPGLLAAGCGDGHPKDESDWTYSPPPDFKQEAKERKGATVFTAEKDHDFVCNLQVKAGTNPYDSAQKIGEMALQKTLMSNGATLKEKEPFQIPDSDAYTWLTTQNFRGVQVSQRQFIVKKNRIVVLFTLTATTNLMDKYDQELADSIKSFKWGRE